MLAARWHGRRDVRVEEIGDPGAVQLDGLITDRIPLARVLEDGITPLIEEATRHLEIIVQP